MSEILFLRLLQAEEKETALAESVAALRDGKAVKPPIYSVDPEAFSKVPGSPFAYWVSDRVRQLFQELPSFEGDGRTVKQGLATADDFRFVRAWWEVNPERIVTGTSETTPEEFRAQTFKGKKWALFAKGGAYSPFYSDLHLVINWERDGEELQAFQGSVVRNPSYYFLPGLTWSDRTTSRFSARVWPSGGVFSTKGSAGFFPGREAEVLGIMNSTAFNGFLALMVGAGDAAARSYQVGTIGRVPYPPDSGLSKRIGELALTAYRLKRELDCSNETSRVFYLPALLQVRGADLHDRIERWNERVRSVEQTLEEIHRTIDTLVFDLYGLDQYDRQSLGDLDAVDAMRDSSASVDEDEDTPSDNTALTLVVDLLSWCVGSVFGRWDVKRALRGDGSAALPDDPFAPLPPCSPGMLVGSEGLPAKPSDTTPDYPIHIQWTGIMPDDEGHPYDLITHVRNVLVQLFPDAYAVEQEACRILGVKDLRQFFGSKFFPLHIQRYSKSRRKAPIYWLLQSSRKSYGLWLYYPRLNRDTLFVALREYVEPKLAHEQEELAKLKAEYAQAKEGGDRGARSLARKVEAQEDLIQEIAAFRDEIKAVADAGYDPDPDDGVLINIAPLHKLVPWKEAAACYKELKAGKYPWATMYRSYKFR